MTFDPLHWDPKTVAREADVDAILTGTLSPCDAGIHATINLVQAPGGSVLWSQSWDVSERELHRLHQGVVHLIVRRLVGAAQNTDVQGYSGIPSHSEAYNHYLMANQISLKPDPQNMMLARDLYTACVEKDPDFAPAWARLGRCHRFLQKFGPDPTPDYRQAHQALERAFSLNPDLVLAHSIYTPIQADTCQAENAMTRLLQKLAVHQNAAELFAALVHACRYCGQLDASVAAHKKARQLDPTLRTSVTHTYFALCDYERSLFWYPAATGYYLDALLLACMGREEEALALLYTRKSKFDLMPAGLRSLHAYLEGDREKGLAVLRASRADARNDPEMIFYLARQASRLGDLDLANEMLLHSVNNGYWCTATMLRDPWLESLRATTQFNRTLDLAKTREDQSREAFLNAGGEHVLS